jgi:hypothetical protein
MVISYKKYYFGNTLAHEYCTEKEAASVPIDVMNPEEEEVSSVLIAIMNPALGRRRRSRRHPTRSTS